MNTPVVRTASTTPPAPRLEYLMTAAREACAARLAADGGIFKWPRTAGE